MHASLPNKFLHYDFLFIEKPRAGFHHMYQYVLVLKDDFSGFVELVPVESADHISVAESMMDWFKRFGIVRQHVSDQGSHFMNKVIDELLSRLHIAHHFTTAYTPWANDTVEIVNRRILFLLKTLLSEFGLIFQDWPSVLPLVNMAINHTVRPRIGYAPVAIFTGLEPSTLLSSIFISRLDSVVDVPLTPARIVELTSELIDALENIHSDASHRITKQRAQQHKSRLNRRNVQPINFAPGDYVRCETFGT
ncbi:Gypsy retrotransposon integrase-like protein 1 [Plasmodiophora brassicae]